ncbi:MAG: acyltransferase family protein [Deltaproteobacteria bacterium]|jgi:1-acyl-sn-glycerol-3-phosphate acyltransferase|nr:acyltransferase family protein [Deltaproteobacteria bacterium]MBW2535165.1 acyltransferase family protein [Deltaproteobacteria bacterium]
MSPDGKSRGVRAEIAERAQRLEIPFNRFGIDPFGVSRSHVERAFGIACWFYRHYFGVNVHGIHNVPTRGRAMLIGNHSGGVALDAAMVMCSLLLEMEPPRLVHSMVEKFIPKVPFLSLWTKRCGQVTGLPEHALQLLEADRPLLVFPEGSRGTAKLFPERYSLVDFGSGFMRLALQTKSPIVPFAFLGGGAAIPTIHNSEALGRLIGAPYVPITPYGLALPLPVRLDIVYGPPLTFEGDGRENDDVIFGYVDQVKSTIASLIERGRRIRAGTLALRDAD